MNTASKSGSCRFNETGPVAPIGDIGLVESHAVRHRLHGTLAAIFVDVGYDYLCSLLRE